MKIPLLSNILKQQYNPESTLNKAKKKGMDD